MLTKVDVLSAQGTLLSLPLQDISDGYLVEKIEGLDPVDAVLSGTTLSGIDGETFQSSRLGKRNIILTLGLEPDFHTTTVYSLRQKLYGYFMPKSEVTLTFYMSQGLTVQIKGIVESMETVLFSQESSVDISILCYTPEFIKTAVTEFAGTTVTGTFNTPIVYPGSVPSGVVFELTANTALTGCTIYHTRPNGQVGTMDIAVAMVSGDILKVNTIPNNKEVVLTSGGSDTSVLYGVAPYSDWMSLRPGTNQVRVVSDVAGVPFTLDYNERYGGL